MYCSILYAINYNTLNSFMFIDFVKTLLIIINGIKDQNVK